MMINQEMIDDETKRSTGARRSHLSWSSLLVAAIAIPAIYVLSSGPILLVASSHEVAYHADKLNRVVAVSTVSPAEWWQMTYAPLVWMADQEWGEPLAWYWQQFMR